MDHIFYTSLHHFSGVILIEAKQPQKTTFSGVILIEAKQPQKTTEVVYGEGMQEDS